MQFGLNRPYSSGNYRQEYAQRKSAAVAIDDNLDAFLDSTIDRLRPQAEGRAVFLDSDGARMMSERFPAAVLRQADAGDILAPHLRQEVARAAWVRSVILRDEGLLSKRQGFYRTSCRTSRVLFRTTLPHPRARSGILWRF